MLNIAVTHIVMEVQESVVRQVTLPPCLWKTGTHNHGRKRLLGTWAQAKLMRQVFVDNESVYVMQIFIIVPWETPGMLHVGSKSIP